MPTDRTTYRYHFKKGNKIIHTSITGDIDRREMEHKQTYGEDGHIKQVGTRTTLEEALAWEKEQDKAGRPTRELWEDEQQKAGKPTKEL